MSYTKTTWVNNTTPIDETNLNKMEQGIYDNSLVVDAITNTLNPTDTETYKTAELTEGQITDVIGVSDILIKGQTSQDGEPTPSSPVDVNVVSGSNVVNTSNKNLLSLPNGTYFNNNVTAIVNKGIITVNGTPGSTPSLLRIILTQPIKLKQNDSIKMNVNNSNGIGTSSNYVAFRLAGIVNGISNDNITDAVCTNANANKTFTATNDTIINQVIIRGNTNVTFNNFVIKPQIELGTTTTTYEPHQGKELPLDLPVENLLNPFISHNAGYSVTNNGVTFMLNSDGTITANGTATESSAVMMLWGSWSETTSYLSLNPNQTYKLSEKNGGKVYLRTKTDSTYTTHSSDTNSSLIESKNDVVYFAVEVPAGKTVNNYIFKPMLEQGSKANAYTPYGTEPIELCEIGNYQDYFYKSGSKWYLHKEIGKFFSDKQSDWTDDNNGRYFRAIDNIVLAPNNAIVGTGKCNVGLVTANQTIPGDGFKGGLAIHSSASRIYISSDVYDNITTTPTLLYYAYITATNTEITDTNLISQLEAIYNAPLYEETNITQENNDLPMVLDITACKDNINGIKAFIRK